MASRAIPQRELPVVSAFMGPRQLYNLAGASLNDVSFPHPTLLVNSVTLRSDATAPAPVLSEMTVPKIVCSAPFSLHQRRFQGMLASNDMVDMASVSC